MEKANASLMERLEAAQSVNRREIFMRELKEGQTDYTFQPPKEDILQHTVLIKRATLGKDVDPTELQVIEVETKNDTGSIETFPLAYLRGSDMLQVSLDLVLTETAKITLAKGKGPIYIIGEYAQEWSEESTEAEESIDGDIEAEAESEEDDVKENKENAAVVSNGVAAAKEAAADRKRKQNEDQDVAGSKKLRVSKGEETTEEAMDEVAEKTAV